MITLTKHIRSFQNPLTDQTGNLAFHFCYKIVYLLIIYFTMKHSRKFINWLTYLNYLISLFNILNRGNKFICEVHVFLFVLDILLLFVHLSAKQSIHARAKGAGAQVTVLSNPQKVNCFSTWSMQTLLQANRNKVNLY